MDEPERNSNPTAVLTAEDRKMITALAPRLKRNGMMDSIWQNAECEVIVSQTICACAKRLANGEEPYSLNTLPDDSPALGVFNQTGLGRLVIEGYIVEGELNSGKTLIPTRKLLDEVQRHLARK